MLYSTDSLSVNHSLSLTLFVGKQKQHVSRSQRRARHVRSLLQQQLTVTVAYGILLLLLLLLFLLLFQVYGKQFVLFTAYIN